MKKIYLSLVGLSFCGAMVAQDFIPAEGGSLPYKLKRNTREAHTSNASPAAVNAKDFAYWIDPVGDVVYNKGIKIYESDPNSNVVGGGYVSPLFMDSTVTYADANNNIYTNGQNFWGFTLDPKSELLLESLEPVVTDKDPYNVDSLSILGRYYIADSTKVDTLYIYLHWGKPDDLNAYKPILSTDLYGATTFAGWRTNYTCAKVMGAGGTPGPVVMSASPTYKLIKYPLQKSDAVKADNYAVYIQMAVSGVTIPAGNILSIYYTYVPEAGSVQSKDLFYSFGSTKPTVNGYGAHIWQQNNVVATADFKDYMIDESSPYGGGLSYSKSARYGIDTIRKDYVFGSPVHSPIMNVKISGKSTVGINEVSNSSFSLEQNAPNPFNNETTISYTLKASAKNVSVIVYNVAGVKMFENAQVNTAAGKYSVKINNSNLAAGVYFYTLNVDGNRATRKMIVSE